MVGIYRTQPTCGSTCSVKSIGQRTAVLGRIPFNAALYTIAFTSCPRRGGRLGGGSWRRSLGHCCMTGMFLRRSNHVVAVRPLLQPSLPRSLEFLDLPISCAGPLLRSHSTHYILCSWPGDADSSATISLWPVAYSPSQLGRSAFVVWQHTQ